MTVPAAYPEASQATSALIWSIVGLVCCGPAAIVGFIQGKNELDAIAVGRRDPSGQGTANAAKIIAIVVAVLYVIGIAFSALIILGGLSVGMLDEFSTGF